MRAVRAALPLRDGGLTQKVQKTLAAVLTPGTTPDYIRLTNEGGAPLATKKFAS